MTCTDEPSFGEDEGAFEELEGVEDGADGTSPGMAVVGGVEVVVVGRYAGIEYAASGNTVSVGVEVLLEHAEMRAVARRAEVATRRAGFMP